MVPVSSQGSGRQQAPQLPQLRGLLHSACIRAIKGQCATNIRTGKARKPRHTATH